MELRILIAIIIVAIIVLGVGGTLLGMWMCGKFSRKETPGAILAPPAPPPEAQDPNVQMHLIQIEMPPPQECSRYHRYHRQPCLVS